MVLNSVKRWRCRNYDGFCIQGLAELVPPAIIRRDEFHKSRNVSKVLNEIRSSPSSD